ncbi:hypothetical protein D1007_59520 [Hordeum vulgare]|nr:hypothetical protein D1007_59520 [Hordeum vulgare]
MGNVDDRSTASSFKKTATVPWEDDKQARPLVHIDVGGWEELTPLKIRSHGASFVMQYDERYTPYIEMTGLLPFVQLVSRSTPNLNAAAVTTFIDRWRPETHSFHLRTGEMTVTLQDVSMITALPIEGKPLCMSTDSEGWRQQMEGLIGMSPQEPEVEDGGKKDRVSAGAPFTWIAANFAHCPENADEEVIQRYARVYMWYVISRTIFADGTGKNAPWMWLKALTVFDNKFSWGSAALAYLYRQLDDACRRTTKDGGVGGCMLLLSVWSWEYLPVGRPKSTQWNTWDDHGNLVRQPTWAYKWDLVSEVASAVNLLYKQYTNEMDSLTPEQVEWQPYGVGPNFGDAHTFELNPLCVQEKHLWLMRCPLICNWAVEFHLPHCVMHQFGFFQPHPPEWVDTDTQLHRQGAEVFHGLHDQATMVSGRARGLGLGDVGVACNNSVFSSGIQSGCLFRIASNVVNRRHTRAMPVNHNVIVSGGWTRPRSIAEHIRRYRWPLQLSMLDK